MSETDVQALMNKVTDLCVEQGKAMDEGDSISANELHEKISIIMSNVKAQGQLSELKQLLQNDDENVKLWAATYLLPTEEELALSVISQVEKSDRLLSIEATTLKDMWNKGMLNL